MFKQLLALVAGLAFAAPVSATSWADINRLEELVANTGTTVEAKECETDKAYGYYRFNKAENIDLLVICTNVTDFGDPDAVWETLAHEATHVMQACQDGPIVPNKFTPRMLRELQEVAPHYYALLKKYSGAHKRAELEAFWMELRAPHEVHRLFVKACYSDPE